MSVTTVPPQEEKSFCFNSRFVHPKTAENLQRLGVEFDRPIMFDYWAGSIDKSVYIGKTDTNLKLLVRSDDEYTSAILRVLKSETEMILMTENSLYVVDEKIPIKRIRTPTD